MFAEHFVQSPDSGPSSLESSKVAIAAKIGSAWDIYDGRAIADMTAIEADLSAVPINFLVGDVDQQLHLFLDTQFMEQTDALLRDMASRYLAYQASLDCSLPAMELSDSAMDISDSACADTDGVSRNTIHVFCAQRCSHRPWWIGAPAKGKFYTKRELKLIKRSFNRGFWVNNKNTWC